MRGADAVLTFGSTTGIESVYWGTPSILAGRCYYAHLDGTYNPDSHEELVDLIRSRLEPKSVEPALMYGYYQMTAGEPYRYFRAEGMYRGRFKGRRVRPGPFARAGVLLADVIRPQRVFRRARKLLRKGA
jgi:hypothetical protein